ncbi:MAG: hypothetical protein ACI31D_04245 [Candidatus Limisoma sp.]
MERLTRRERLGLTILAVVCALAIVFVWAMHNADTSDKPQSETQTAATESLLNAIDSLEADTIATRHKKKKTNKRPNKKPSTSDIDPLKDKLKRRK